MLEDLRVTLRTVVRGRWFSVAAIAILALGSGFNTAVFSVINAILYRPPPVHAPGELRYVYGISSRNRGANGLSFTHFLELREQRDVFSDATLVSVRPERIRAGGTIERTQGERVASNYFDVLGVKPIIGRGFVWEEDEAVNAERVAVISYDLWRTRYLSDPNVIGRTLELSSDSWFGSYSPWRPHTIVGVMPKEFKGMANPWEATAYWVPFLRDAADAQALYRQVRGPDPRSLRPADYGGLPIVRLRPDVAPGLAALRVRELGERVRQQFVNPPIPDWSLKLFESRLIGLPFDPAREIVPSRLAAAFMCVSCVVLLIASSNLASLLMARGIARRSEMALRLTLGATRGRLMRQLTAESLVLSAAGGVCGTLLARWLIDVFIAGTPSRSLQWSAASISLDVPIDWRVMAFTAGSCLVTGLVVGLLPARRVLRADLLAGLAGQSISATPATRASLQRWVVVPQVCCSLVLLLLAGVLARTMIRAEMRSPGYDAAGVTLVDVDTPFERSGVTIGAAYRDTERVKAANEERLDRIQRLLMQITSMSGITAATVVPRTPTANPLPLPWLATWVAPRDGFAPNGRHVWISQIDVSPGYFTTLRVPVLRGRDFDARDRRNSADVAIVSETLARALWPNADPIGQYLGGHQPDDAREPKWREVVGVVGDVRLPLTDTTWNPAMYAPSEQQPGMGLPSMIAARGERGSGELMRGLSAAVRAAEPEAIAVNERLMRDEIAELLYPRRVSIAVLALAGIVGLLLASSGLYGLISYSVAQRVREIGVRMALGADRGDIRRLIVREGVGVSAAGIALGVVFTYITIRVVSRWVVTLPSLDPLTFTIVPAVLAGIILLACYVPALRAARVEPMTVLRGL